MGFKNIQYFQKELLLCNKCTNFGKMFYHEKSFINSKTKCANSRMFINFWICSQIHKSLWDKKMFLNFKIVQILKWVHIFETLLQIQKLYANSENISMNCLIRHKIKNLLTGLKKCTWSYNLKNWEEKNEK